MYEHHTSPLLSRRAFLSRVASHMAKGLFLLMAGLGTGVLGYHYIAGFRWVDSLLNASMILGGMGPVDPLPGDAAKLFASAYALFSGLAFVGVVSLMIAPFAHRILHRLHLEEDE
jgi:hypothetical protein